MKKRKIRDILNLIIAFLWVLVYLPHLILYLCDMNLKILVNADLEKRKTKININLSNIVLFVYFIHNDRFFRNLYYHRIGPIFELLIGWWRPGDKYFVISKTTRIGGGAYFAHPFASVLNAKSIGENFSCRHLTTIGNKVDGDNDNRPTIGDNVTLGVNVTIIGGVNIGNNVTIGAGSVVVKDIPDNCVAVGNPCKPIKFLNE